MKTAVTINGVFAGLFSGSVVVLLCFTLATFVGNGVLYGMLLAPFATYFTTYWFYKKIYPARQARIGAVSIVLLGALLLGSQLLMIV